MGSFNFALCARRKKFKQEKTKKKAHLDNTFKDGGKKRKKGKETTDGPAKKKTIQKEKLWDTIVSFVKLLDIYKGTIYNKYHA